MMQHLQHFVDHCPNIQKLVLKGCDLLDVERFSLPQLSDLDLRGVVATNEVLIQIFGAHKQLETLRLGWISEFATPRVALRLYTSLGNVVFLSNLENCSNLKKLSLAGCTLINAASLLKVIRSCPLTSLDLCSVGCVDTSLVSALAEARAASLTDLNLRATNVGNRATQQLALHCTELRRLNLSCTDVSQSGIVALVDSAKNLQDLDLCYCDRILVQERHQVFLLVLYIARKMGSRLKMLGVGGFKLNDDTLIQLSKLCKNINHLGIGGCPDLTSQGLLEMARNCPSLTNINAHQLPKITYASVIEMAKICKEMVAINVSGSDKGGFGMITEDEINRLHFLFPYHGDDWQL